MDRLPVTVHLDAATRARADAEAAALNLTVEEYLIGIVTAALSPTGVAEDASPFEVADQRTEAAKLYQREQARIALAEFDRTGVSIPLEDALVTFDAALEAGLARKR